MHVLWRDKIITFVLWQKVKNGWQFSHVFNFCSHSQMLQFVYGDMVFHCYCRPAVYADNNITFTVKSTCIRARRPSPTKSTLSSMAATLYRPTFFHPSYAPVDVLYIVYTTTSLFCLSEALYRCLIVFKFCLYCIDFKPTTVIESFY